MRSEERDYTELVKSYWIGETIQNRVAINGYSLESFAQTKEELRDSLQSSINRDGDIFLKDNLNDGRGLFFKKVGSVVNGIVTIDGMDDVELAKVDQFIQIDTGHSWELWHVETGSYIGKMGYIAREHNSFSNVKFNKSLDALIDEIKGDGKVVELTQEDMDVWEI